MGSIIVIIKIINDDYYLDSIIIIITIVIVITAFFHRIITQVMDSFKAITLIVMRSHCNSLQVIIIITFIVY